MNIGLLIIATGKYKIFLDNLIKSADVFFMNEHEVTYYLFVDEIIDIESNRKIEQIIIEHREWPYPTLLRYKHFYDNNEKISKNDYLYYVDSDSVFIKQIPMEWFEECLPDGTFLSFYDRTHQYTETGFLAFNSENDICNSFFEMYKGYYTHDTVYNIYRSGSNGKQKPFWTDCHTLDGTREAFKNNKQYIEKKLGDGGSAHIMARDNFINPYIDHRKGNRKHKQNSPEWAKIKGK